MDNRQRLTVIRPLILALALGTITTIVVAWICAARSGLALDGHLVRMPTFANGTVDGTIVCLRSPGAILVIYNAISQDVINDLGATVSVHDAFDIDWTHAFDPDYESRWMFESQQASGWPFLSLRWERDGWQIGGDKEWSISKGITLFSEDRAVRIQSANQPKGYFSLPVTHVPKAVLPLTPSWRGLGLSITFYFVVWYAFLAATRFCRCLIHQRKVRRGICPTCGYPLRTLISGRCPECGYSINVGDVVHDA